MVNRGKDGWNKGMLQKRETKSSQTMRNHKKTPLQQFDVAAFFEENLFDIIDLEENRSGVKEFEDAVKKEE
ncbi:MAG: hypothetical protein Q4Q00_09690 [Turicibacter sp.]|nr:hypothetical protein [Turicibacter sp.]